MENIKIVISGTYSTGKTLTSLALSVLTGIPVTHAKTMRELIKQYLPGRWLENCNFHELMELGIRRYTERVNTEKRIGDSFISDGCTLQEWLYGTTRTLTGLNPSESGFNVLCTYNHNEINSSMLEIKGKVVPVKVDVCKKEEIEGLGRFITSNKYEIKGLVYNTGIIKDSLFESMSEKDFVDVLDVNLVGCFRICLCWNKSQFCRSRTYQDKMIQEIPLTHNIYL